MKNLNFGVETEVIGGRVKLLPRRSGLEERPSFHRDGMNGKEEPK